MIQNHPRGGKTPRSTEHDEGHQMESETLTANEHDADREDLLWVGVGRHVAEADTGETAEGEVQRSHVLGLDGWTLCIVYVRLACLSSQFIQPTDFRFF